MRTALTPLQESGRGPQAFPSHSAQGVSPGSCLRQIGHAAAFKFRCLDIEP